MDSLRRLSSKVAVSQDAVEEEGGLLEDSLEAKAVLSEENKQTARIKRQALIAGMTIITQGSCQDFIYGILNFVSATIVGFQFYLNLQTLFFRGQSGCAQSKDFSAATLWFWAQLIMNGLATIGQFSTWFFSWFKTIMFCFRHGKYPTSQFASSNNPKETWLEMQVRMEFEDFDDMEPEEQEECMAQIANDPDFNEVPLEFKQDMKSMATAGSLQSWLTTSRAIIGALGAIVEPSLTAQAAFLGIAKKGTEATKALAGMEKCVALRQTSAAGSGIVAAVGLKQSQMRNVYTKLVMLAQIRESKRRDGNVDAATMERYDVAMEKEIMDACGPQGQGMLSFMSGKPTK